MPIVRKIALSEAAAWKLESAPVVLDALLDRIAGDDRGGLTRIDRSGKASGEHGWRGRVFFGSSEMHRQFSDAIYGGAAGALRAAIAWRKEARAAVPPRRARVGRTWRVVRAEYGRNCGWLAYADQRKYFADGKYGGHDAARRAAEAWMEARRPDSA